MTRTTGTISPRLLASLTIVLARVMAQSCDGQCADIESNTCSTGFVSGLCPGESNIQCCTGQLCPGQCASTDDYTCSSGFTAGLCAGADNVQCCSGTLAEKTTSCSGTCADINSNTCSSGFEAGLCPGASNIQCCTGQLCDGKCLCSGADNVQCCSGTLTKKAASCSGTYATSTWPNSKTIAAFFRDTQGITNPRALAVILGNLQQESNLNPLSCEAYGGPASSLSSCPITLSGSYYLTGVGLLQWSDPDNQPGRRTQLFEYCRAQGLDCDLASTQLQFLAQEDEWARAKECFQTSGKELGTTWDNAGATAGSYWKCAALWTGWGTAGNRADYALQWLARCKDGDDSAKCQCADINTNTCSTGFVSGLCPGASNIQCCKGTVTPRSDTGKYNRDLAVAYARKYWNSPNHDCGQSYSSCSPYSYWGGEHCGYTSQGGDCANFVSQCLLAGGHTPLNDGGPCRGYPCGSEEIGAANLGECLATYKGWTRTCGYHAPPPADIMVGDVLVYHEGSCSDSEAHATIVTAVEGGVRITCHSSEKLDEPYTYLEESKPYYEWLHTSSYALTTNLALNASRERSAASALAGPFAPLCCAFAAQLAALLL
eukprot:m51a1_g14526 hypothetical protein (601) ;mRNA; r:920077-922599